MLFELNKKHSISLASPFPDGLERLSRHFGGSPVQLGPAKVWDIAEVIIECGIDWPDWVEYHKSLRRDYVSELNGLPEFRDCKYNSQEERRSALKERCRIFYSLTHRYIPSEVGIPQFVEGSPVRPSDFRRFAEDCALSITTMWEYFLRSFLSSQVSSEHTNNFSPSAILEMEGAQLIVWGAQIPQKNKIEILNMTEIRSILGGIGKKLPRTLADAKADLFMTIVDGSTEAQSLLEQIRDWEKYSCILPPKGMDWLQFQSARQQVRGMATAIGDLYYMDINKKYREDLFLLNA